MARRGVRSFDKVVHYYEPYVQNKSHKIGIKMKFTDSRTSEDSKPPIYFTDYFKSRGIATTEFNDLNDLYEWIDDNLVELPPLDWKPKIFIKVSGYGSPRTSSDPGTSLRRTERRKLPRYRSG